MKGRLEMIKKYIDLWQKNKASMKDFLKRTRQENLDYKLLLSKTIELSINCDLNDYDKLDTENIIEMGDGDYQGCLVYVISPCKAYVTSPYPNSYVTTYVWYGSCSGCDALEGIREYDDGLPNDNQIESYMLLCLHMLERMKKLYEEVY